ncbi:hypothetical protein VNI00_002640 [Paramarasmius palmivorus]|uniref:Uncharacterized protein n=1 Tax=Paramarasmius palmivorus TaxID=297713 RepID=A0AAW0DYV8_9AGAR
MTQSQSPQSSNSSSISSTEYHTQWCPVCDRQIAPKRTQVPIPPEPTVIPPYVHSQRKRRGFLEGTTSQLKQAQAFAKQQQQQHQPQRLRTVIDQGPCPLYCSEECRLEDITSRSSWRGADDDKYPTYSLYPFTTNNSSGSDPDETDSISTSSTSDSLPSPTEELPPKKSSSYSSFPFKTSSSPATSSPSLITAHASSSLMSSGALDNDFLPLVPPKRPFVTAEQRSKSFQHPPSRPSTASSVATPRYRNGSCERSTPCSLPTNTDDLLSKFSLSFSRRSESRVSLYSGTSTPDYGAHAPLSTSPSRRPLAAHGLLVPDILTSRPSTCSSRPPTARRNSSTSSISNRSRTGSMASVGSSRPSIHSPLGQYGSDSELEEEEEEYAPRSPVSASGYCSPFEKRPALETRSWSNDNFKTVTLKSSRRSAPPSRPDGKRLFLFPTD